MDMKTWFAYMDRHSMLLHEPTKYEQYICYKRCENKNVQWKLYEQSLGDGHLSKVLYSD